MSVITIILFFLYTWGLGFTASMFVKSSENFLERNLMRVGIGLGIFPILAILINFLHVPLDWKLFLALSLICPLFKLILKIRNGNLKFNLKFKLKKSTLTIFIVLIIFLFTFFMYHNGSFIYPYLENSDPWSHAEGAKYVSIEKTAMDPLRENPTRNNDPITYMDPYPPSYDILMGILHQTNDSINWTLKFFNALIISLGIIFFYFFAKEFIGNRNKALFSAFVLAAIPCYLSHFIWAHALIVTMFFPVMYCLERIKYGRKWWIPASLIIASIFVIQPTQPVKLGALIFIYFAAKSAFTKKLDKEVLFALFSGILLSLFWWGNMVFKYGSISGVASAVGFVGETSAAANVATAVSSPSVISVILKIFNPAGGTGTRAYTFSDFFIAQHNNMINNPIGVGIVLSLLSVVSLIIVLVKYKSLFKKMGYWLPVTLAWLLFTFLGVNSMTFHLPVGLLAFRFWMLLAIPIALICSEGLWFLIRTSKKYNIPSIIILILVISGITLTSAWQKHSLNTALWPQKAYYGGGSPQAGFEYSKWFKTLPKNTAVFTYGDIETDLVIGFDMFSCSWCEDMRQTIKSQCILNLTSEELYSFLKKYHYEYLLMGSTDFKNIGETECGFDRTNDELPKKIEEFISSDSFQPVYQEENLFIAFKVK